MDSITSLSTSTYRTLLHSPLQIYYSAFVIKV